jgi:hypothetical protein
VVASVVAVALAGAVATALPRGAAARTGAVTRSAWYDSPGGPPEQTDAFDGAVDVQPDRLLDPSPGVQLAGMNPINPGRLLDTRDGTGAPVGALAAGATLEVAVLGQFGVPASGVDAVALNMTVTESTAPSFLTVWPSGSSLPLASSLNMLPNQTVANLVIAKVGDDGAISIATGFGTTHVVADIVGWSPSATFLRSLAPQRVLDTRDGTGVAAPGAVGPAGVVDLAVTGAKGVPAAGVDAVILNVTVTEATAPSFVTVWPTGEAQPTASSLNTLPSETNPNLVIAKVGAGGRISLFNANGNAHLVADLVGWIPTGGAYTSISPDRVLDTRVAGNAGRVRAGSPLVLNIAAPLGLPPSTSAVLLNLTGTQATAPTFITAWGFGAPQPAASSLNIVPGQTRPNLVMVELGDDGLISLANQNGQIHLVADVVGYFEARNVLDDLDEVVGEQVHVLHVIPNDQPAATFGDADILHALDLAEGWLEQRGGKGIRFDTVGGAIDISTHRIQESSATIAADANANGFKWLDWMLADGFATDGKAYIVYVEGAQVGSLCGLGGFGQARVFTEGCSDAQGGRPNTTGTWTTMASSRTALHELLHVLGAVASCAPDQNGTGHVRDINDLMYFRQRLLGSGEIVAGSADVLDAGRNDYWGQGGGRTCPNGSPWTDVSLSAFLDAPR